MSFFTDELKIISIKGLSAMGEVIRRKTLKNMCHSFFNTGYRLVAWEPDILCDTLFFKELCSLRELLEAKTPEVIAWRPVGDIVTGIFDEVFLPTTTSIIRSPVLKDKLETYRFDQIDTLNPFTDRLHQSSLIVPGPSEFYDLDLNVNNQPNARLSDNLNTCYELNDGLHSVNYTDHGCTAGDRLEQLTDWLNK